MRPVKQSAQSGPTRRAARRQARVAESRKAPPGNSATRYIVVGLTDDGDELDRVTVDGSKLSRAKEVLLGFADRIDVICIDADGQMTKVPP